MGRGGAFLRYYIFGCDFATVQKRRQNNAKKRRRRLRRGFTKICARGKVAIVAFAIIMAFNCVQAFITAGPPPYLAFAHERRSVKVILELDHWKETR